MVLKFLSNLPGRLQRVTSGGKLIEEVDGLRFLAIFPVVVQHLSERIERNFTVTFHPGPGFEVGSFLANRGFIGVYIFFVISGFILALPFASSSLNQTKPIPLKKYYLRRLTRLEPPYIILMTLFFIALALSQSSFRELFSHYLASITYLHNIIYGKWTPLNPPAWTLEIEVQFYIIAPFLAMALFKIGNHVRRRVILAALILGVLVIQDLLQLAHRPYNFTILGHINYFLVGFLLADVYLIDWKGKAPEERSRWYDLIAVLSFIALLYSWSWDQYLANRVLFCTFLFTLFLSVFKGVVVNRFFRNPWITSTGGMCYTIYLIHLPLAEFFIQFSKEWVVTDHYLINLAVQLILFLPIVYAASIFFFLTLEKPCMDRHWPNKLYSWFKTRLALGSSTNS